MVPYFYTNDQEVTFVVIKTEKSVDITPFCDKEVALMACIRYVRKNRDRFNIPEDLTNEYVLKNWTNFTKEFVLIFNSYVWDFSPS